MATAQKIIGEDAIGPIYLAPRKMKTKGKYPLIQIEEGEVQAISRRSTGDNVIIPGAIFVTWAGKAYYEERPRIDTFVSGGGLRLGTDDTSITKCDADVLDFLPGSERPLEVNFPEISRAACTWVYDYGQGFSFRGIVEGAIVNDLANPTRALTRFVFNERFNKLKMDTLRIEVRHWIAHLWG